ncbi:MAG: SIS domain-containing protein [Acidobacteriaceae bacterium]|jgi:D-sedoheptulose 7-phosphate isomerase|nr:SIS domain-containing protein [Acidobacteriaceae bacterium]
MTEALNDVLSLFSQLGELRPVLDQAAALAAATLRNGRKLLLCGNGGSACEAQHLAGELAGRYKHDRRALAAVSLNADGAVLTCIGNDYSFDDVFARQIEAIGQPGDLLVVFTTSGQSPNVVRALEAANRLGIASVAFLGRGGGAALPLATLALVVPHHDTARIQEAHQFLLHCLMDRIEAASV